jgi:proteasome lid subunit RPN8/RPN11
VTRVALPAPVLEAIREAALAAYPDECCGLLLSPEGAAEPDLRRVVAVAPAENRSPENRRRRFVIPAAELKGAEERAARDRRLVTGFYHSHPDHPARPSEFDRDHAWPWYTYLVVAVRPGPVAGPVGAFELDAERREFFEIPLSVVPSEATPAAAPPGGP